MFAIVRLATLGLLVTLVTSAVAADCDATPGVERFARSGWGFGERNLRFQPDTDIDRSNVQTLELAWAFALDGGMSPHSYPLVTEDTVFIGTPAGTLFALERDSGCVRWKRKFRSTIRTAVIHAELEGKAQLVFGTGDGWVIAADAITGKQLWETEVRDHPHGIVTGTPLYHEGRVYAPVSSYELAVAIHRHYGEDWFDDIQAALVEGYREVRPLAESAVAMLPMFLLVRSLVHLGWRAQRPEHGTDLSEDIEDAVREARDWMG